MTEIMRTIPVNSPIVSLLLPGLYWHPWLTVGVLVDIGILIALLWDKLLSGKLLVR